MKMRVLSGDETGSTSNKYHQTPLLPASHLLSPEPSPPPWTLHGSALLFLRSWKSALGLIHYSASPVGLYNELAVAEWRQGSLSIVEMLVTSRDSMIGGRRGWGFPKEVAPLRWEEDGPRVIFEYSAKYSRRWRARLWGPGFPLRASLSTVQQLDGVRVRVPCKIKGKARFAFRGRQLGLFIQDFEMTVLPPISLNNAPR